MVGARARVEAHDEPPVVVEADPVERAAQAVAGLDVQPVGLAGDAQFFHRLVAAATGFGQRQGDDAALVVVIGQAAVFLQLDPLVQQGHPAMAQLAVEPIDLAAGPVRAFFPSTRI